MTKNKKAISQQLQKKYVYDLSADCKIDKCIACDDTRIGMCASCEEGYQLVTLPSSRTHNKCVLCKFHKI